jgi:broad specificity phosphatase PhoE
VVFPARPFYLIRHGQTDANANKIVSGGTEATLTEEGISKAAHLGGAILRASPLPSVIIHSGRTRTLGTAERINKILKLPMVVDKGLDEHNYGEWIGLPVNPYVDRVMAGETPPGGESLDVFADRVRRNLGAVLEQNPPSPLLVLHGGTFRAFAHLYGKVWHSQNCILHYFEPDKAATDFPWKIWKFEPENGILRRESVTLS